MTTEVLDRNVLCTVDSSCELNVLDSQGANPSMKNTFVIIAVIAAIFVVAGLLPMVTFQIMEDKESNKEKEAKKNEEESQRAYDLGNSNINRKTINEYRDQAAGYDQIVEGLRYARFVLVALVSGGAVTLVTSVLAVAIERQDHKKIADEVYSPPAITE